MAGYGRRAYGDEYYEDERLLRGQEPEWERPPSGYRSRGPYGPQYGSWSVEDAYAYGGYPLREPVDELDAERGILDTLTDAVTGRSNEEDIPTRSYEAPRRSAV